MPESEQTLFTIELLGNIKVFFSDLHGLLFLLLILHTGIYLNEVRVEIQYAWVILTVQRADHSLCAEYDFLSIFNFLPLNQNVTLVQQGLGNEVPRLVILPEDRFEVFNALVGCYLGLIKGTRVALRIGLEVHFFH
jgi:hypothetical protein